MCISVCVLVCAHVRAHNEVHSQPTSVISSSVKLSLGAVSKSAFTLFRITFVVPGGYVYSST